MKNTIIFIIILISGFVLSVNAQKTKQPKTAEVVEEKCVKQAWIGEGKANKYIFVHATPNPTSKVVGEIIDMGDEEVETTIEIIGYSNGWVKIRKAYNSDFEKAFEGTGWISAERVTVTTQRLDGNMKKGVTLYAKPSSKSKSLGTIPNEKLVKVIGYDCFGLKVKYKNKTGWLSKDQLCGNPVTTCS